MKTSKIEKLAYQIEQASFETLNKALNLWSVIEKRPK